MQQHMLSQYVQVRQRFASCNETRLALAGHDRSYSVPDSHNSASQIVMLQNTHLNCSFLHQLGHLVTVGDHLTATRSSHCQSNCLHGWHAFTVLGPVV